MNGETRREVSLLGVGFAVSALFCAALGWLTSEVLAGDVARFDEAVRAAVREQWLWSKPLMLFCTFIGGPSFLGVASLVLFVGLWRRRMRHQDGLLVAAMAGGILLSVLLKECFRRPRPVPFYDLPQPLTFSYPSGHALASACFFVALGLLFSPFLRGPRRVALWGACIAAIVLIGFSRVYLGVHWPSDVIGGWLTGGVWMSFVWGAFSHLLPPEAGAGPEEPRA